METRLTGSPYPSTLAISWLIRLASNEATPSLASGLSSATQRAFSPARVMIMLPFTPARISRSSSGRLTALRKRPACHRADVRVIQGLQALRLVVRRPRRSIHQPIEADQHRPLKVARGLNQAVQQIIQRLAAPPPLCGRSLCHTLPPRSSPCHRQSAQKPLICIL
jgi:hypothetical protein